MASKIKFTSDVCIKTTTVSVKMHELQHQGFNILQFQGFNIVVEVVPNSIYTAI